MKLNMKQRVRGWSCSILENYIEAGSNLGKQKNCTEKGEKKSKM